MARYTQALVAALAESSGTASDLAKRVGAPIKDVCSTAQTLIRQGLAHLASEAKPWVYCAGPSGAYLQSPDKRTWNAKRDAELTALVKAGLTAEAAGARLGVSRDAVIGRARRLKLPLGGGVDRNKIGIHNRRRSAVHRAANDAKLAPPTNRLPPVAPEGSPVPAAVTPPKPERPPKWEEVIPGAAHQPVVGLRPGHCRWPVNGEGADTLHCCKPKVRGAYCEGHAGRAYVASTPSRNAAKPALDARRFNGKRADGPAAQWTRFA
jgi:GcrA cell cycle regulator